MSDLRVTPVAADGDSATDGISDAVRTIESEHDRIHREMGFFYTDAITLNNAGTQDYLIDTGSAKFIHFTFQADFIFVTQLQLFEASDKTGTTGQTIYNRKRTSAVTSTVTLKKGTSGGTTDGTQIFNYKSGLSTGNGSNRVTGGGNLAGRHELDLKQNTKYLMRITSSTDSNLINVLFDWYESDE